MPLFMFASQTFCALCGSKCANVSAAEYLLCKWSSCQGSRRLSTVFVMSSNDHVINHIMITAELAVPLCRNHLPCHSQQLVKNPFVLDFATRRNRGNAPPTLTDIASPETCPWLWIGLKPAFFPTWSITVTIKGALLILAVTLSCG